MTGEKRVLGSELLEAAAVHAPAFGVSGTIHPDDFIFWYIHDDVNLTDKREAPYHYLQSGKDTAALVAQLLAEHGVQLALAKRPRPEQQVSLLEFASGYGRVTRHFPVCVPSIEVVACDIHGEAIQFMRDLGLQAVQSASVPERLSTGRLFNAIFAFSFFTHMPRSTWGRWLRALAKQLEPNGLLIFTAHGEISQPLMGVGTLEPDGFFFHSDSEQKDLDGAEYGNTVTTFEFVAREIMRSGLKLLQFRQAGAGHHDVYIVHKVPDGIVYGDADTSFLAEENRLLRTQVEVLKASHSWRLTAPFRRLSKALYRRG